MQPEERDAAYLWDMLDAARSIRDMTAGVSVEEYSRNRTLYRAVEREIEIIGEAARHISESFTNAHSETPWRGIIGQRNVLAHKYGEINQERIWAVATRSIPELIIQLESMLPPPGVG